jgi:serine/threonine protein kinase
VQILHQLRHIHANRRVHRDVRPENIFVQDDGRVAVGDAGPSIIVPDSAIAVNDTKAAASVTPGHIKKEDSGKALSSCDSSYSASSKLHDTASLKGRVLDTKMTKRSFRGRSVAASCQMQDLPPVFETAQSSSSSSPSSSSSSSSLSTSSVARKQACPGDFYFPPEESADDYRYDIYAVGVIMLEIWCPFVSEVGREIALLQFTSQRRLPARLVKHHPEIAKLVLRMTAPIPSDRPSCKEFIISLSFA